MIHNTPTKKVDDPYTRGKSSYKVSFQRNFQYISILKLYFCGYKDE